MRLSFSVTPHGTFIVTGIDGDRVVYAEEHSPDATLLDVVNAARYSLGIGPVTIQSKEPRS